MKKTLKVGDYGITYLGDDFKERFGSVKVSPKKCNLKGKILERPMNDKEILAEFKPKPISLDELVYTLKHSKDLLRNSRANIFYIKGKDLVLRAVSVGWGVNGWLLSACPLEDPDGWSADDRVFSRNFLKTLKTFDPSKLKITYEGIEYKLTT